MKTEMDRQGRVLEYSMHALHDVAAVIINNHRVVPSMR